MLSLLCLALIGGLTAFALTRERRPAPSPPDARAALAERLDRLLPQTQCRQCLYDGCRPYADAMAQGEAQINRCPPGGEATIALLARELGREPMPLDPRHGTHGPLQLARIDESRCIGCRLCIKACPVDAIVGAPKLMHTVLAEDCTGCELCLPPCPVDCIDLLPAPALPPRQGTPS
ncbi:MAG: RnfABCDGE type electron transport complex subunit B [Pseudomonadota bacterium]